MSTEKNNPCSQNLEDEGREVARAEFVHWFQPLIHSWCPVGVPIASLGWRHLHDIITFHESYNPMGQWWWKTTFILVILNEYDRWQNLLKAFSWIRLGDRVYFWATFSVNHAGLPLYECMCLNARASLTAETLCRLIWMWIRQSYKKERRLIGNGQYGPIYTRGHVVRAQSGCDEIQLFDLQHMAGNVNGNNSRPLLSTAPQTIDLSFKLDNGRLSLSL